MKYALKIHQQKVEDENTTHSWKKLWDEVMRCCLTPQISNSSRPFYPWGQRGTGRFTHCVNTTYQWVGMWACIISLVPHILYLMSLITQPMVPSVVIINIHKYNIFYRPDEAMLFVMVKACVGLKIILLFNP